MVGDEGGLLLRELLAVLIAWKPQADKRYVFAGVDGEPLAPIPAWNSLRKAAELVISGGTTSA